MTKHKIEVDYPGKAQGDPGNPQPARTLGELETMLGKAKLVAPGNARITVINTMGGKPKKIIVEWED